MGKILFRFSLSRKNYKARAKQKDIEKRLKEHKIDLCWWAKQNFKNVSTTSFDHLKLHGRYFDNSSEKTVIVVHGFGQSSDETQQFCQFFMQKNFNILVVDCRAHSKSGGDCVGFGWLDRKDILSWVDFLNSKNPERKIVLFGISMGATAVCCACGEKLPTNVVAAISDSAFATAEKQFDFILKKYYFFGKVIKKHLFGYARRVHDFDLRQADATKQVRNTKVPILFIHGQDDDYVPIENMYALYNSAPESLRDKYVVEEAGHVLGHVVAGVLYEKKICDFLRSRTRISI